MDDQTQFLNRSRQNSQYTSSRALEFSPERGKKTRAKCSGRRQVSRRLFCSPFILQSLAVWAEKNSCDSECHLRSHFGR
jgi:hypothetical protein